MITTFLLNQNFSFSTLFSGVASGATLLTVASGQGSRFPATGNFMCVLWNQSLSTPSQDSSREIIEVTSRSVDTFTIVRAQESTIDKAWNSGDNIALVLTAGKVTELETAINLRYGSGDSPSFAAITVSTLTASVPVVSDGSKNLVSVTYATFKSNLSLSKADISGLGTGDSPTFTGLNLSGLTASKVVVTDGSKNLASGTNTDAQISAAVTASHAAVTLTTDLSTNLLSLLTQQLDINHQVPNVIFSGPTTLVDYVPNNMTTNDLPVPYAASGSTKYNSGTDYYMAFDGVTGTTNYWLANAATGYVNIDMGLGNLYVITSYAVQINSIDSTTRAPKDWQLRGKVNVGDSWTTFDSQTGITAWSAGQKKTYSCPSNVTAYRYFQFNITLNNGDAGYTGISELYLYTGAVAPTFRSLVNADFPATLSLSIAGLNLSGLTASEPVVTDASKNLASVSYATFKSSLSLAQADISGLTTGSSPAFLGLTIDTNTLYVDSTHHRVGILTTSPTCDISLGNGAAREIWIENTATDVVGRNLIIAAGGTVAGTSVNNVVGGNLTLQAGLGTGSAVEYIYFQIGTTLGSGKTLQTMTTQMSISGSGLVNIPGLTASLPVVTDGSQNLVSVSYATFKSSLAIAQADVTGLHTADSPTFVGETLSGLTGTGIRYVTTSATGVLGVSGGIPYYLSSFTNANLTAGILTVTHNLGVQYGSVTIVDNTGKEILPDDVTFTSTTALAVDLTSYGTLTGTWQVSFLSAGGTIQTLPQALGVGDSPTFNHPILTDLTIGSLGGFLFGTAGVVSALTVAQRMAIGQITKDISSAGTSVVSGLSFSPSMVIFVASGSDPDEFSVGFDDGTTHVVIEALGTFIADSFDSASSFSIYLLKAAGTTYQGLISSLTADGFVITWTRTGTPTGSTKINYLAFR
jgi:hypothetical protein